MSSESTLTDICRKQQRHLADSVSPSAMLQALKPSASETPRRGRARRANAVRQYAFHTGVPFIVLTDGRTWSFYLPAEQGSYEAESARRHDDVFRANRRVCKLDLFERPPARTNCHKRAQRAQRTMRSLRSFAANSVTRHSAFDTRHSKRRNRRSQARAALLERFVSILGMKECEDILALRGRTGNKAPVKMEET